MVTHVRRNTPTDNPLDTPIHESSVHKLRPGNNPKALERQIAKLGHEYNYTKELYIHCVAILTRSSYASCAKYYEFSEQRYGHLDTVDGYHLPSPTQLRTFQFAYGSTMSGAKHFPPRMGENVREQNFGYGTLKLARFLFDPDFRDAVRTLQDEIGFFEDISHAVGLLFNKPKYWYKNLKKYPEQSAKEILGEICHQASSLNESAQMVDAFFASLFENSKQLLQNKRILLQIYESKFPQVYEEYITGINNKNNTGSNRAEEKTSWARALTPQPLPVDSITGILNLPSKAQQQVIDLMEENHGQLLAGILPGHITPDLAILNSFYHEHIADQEQEVIDACYRTLMNSLTNRLTAQSEVIESAGDLRTLLEVTAKHTTAQELQKAREELDQKH